MREALLACRGEHQRLGGEIRAELRRFQDEGKEPGAVAKAMSRMKTETNLLLRESDATIADLMTDGCNMGVKSLSRYLNQYQAADERSKDIARRLIRQEQDLAFQMRSFL